MSEIARELEKSMIEAEKEYATKYKCGCYGTKGYKTKRQCIVSCIATRVEEMIREAELKGFDEGILMANREDAFVESDIKAKRADLHCYKCGISVKLNPNQAKETLIEARKERRKGLSLTIYPKRWNRRVK